jgi:DNA-binding CsgD family transcriptional regulator
VDGLELPNLPPEGAAAFLKIFDFLPQGIVLLDKGHRVLYSNAAARLFSQDARNPLSTAVGFVFTCPGSINARLQSALLEAVAPGISDQHVAHLVRLPRQPPLRPLTAIIRRLEVPKGNAPLIYALLALVDPALQVELAIAVAARQYGFTQAEAQLVGALTQGTCMSDYAESRAVSLNTVKTQLKHVLAKTGVHRQAELVGLILGIPTFLA